jgi:hypothetical protein
MTSYGLSCFLMKLSFILFFVVGLGGVNNFQLKVEGFFNFSHMCFNKTVDCFINVEMNMFH